MIDAHTHLNQEGLFPDWKQHLENFGVIGGKVLVNTGANEVYNRNGILIAQESLSLFPRLCVKATIGFHPCDVKEIQRVGFGKMITDLEQQYLVNKEHLVAI